MESKHFVYDGVKSKEMGIYIVRIGGGGASSPFFGGQTPKEERLAKKLTPYVYGMDYTPIEFTLTLSPLDEEWTPKKREEIGKWLVTESYKPFQTDDDMGKVYYAMVTSAPDFTLFSQKGYIEVNFKTTSPYAWTLPRITEHSVPEGDGVVLEWLNKSNISGLYYPEIEIELLGNNREIEVRNLSNGGKGFSIKDLHKHQTLAIDNENEFLKSSLEGDNLFKKFSGDWLGLVYGVNRIEVKGACKIWTRMQFPILQ